MPLLNRRLGVSYNFLQPSNLGFQCLELMAFCEPFRAKRSATTRSASVIEVSTNGRGQRLAETRGPSFAAAPRPSGL